MLSGLNDVLVSALPVVCVVAGTSLAVVLVIAWLVRDLGIRAIAKAAPDQVAAVVGALPGLVSPFRWIWPWSRKIPARRREGVDERTGPSAEGCS
jgi:hypothetical protein